MANPIAVSHAHAKCRASTHAGACQNMLVAIGVDRIATVNELPNILHNIIFIAAQLAVAEECRFWNGLATTIHRAIDGNNDQWFHATFGYGRVELGCDGFEKVAFVVGVGVHPEHNWILARRVVTGWKIHIQIPARLKRLGIKPAVHTMIGGVVDNLAFKTSVKPIKLASPEKAMREKNA
jgi:hypothetical protein